mmetsp:Transcript_10442/g.30688  ORF Transcript_10442/g.30688 Transcript_10442/m.30688 type:complete len:392 (-) Transcript_10442:1910-3085(-)
MTARRERSSNSRKGSSMSPTATASRANFWTSSACRGVISRSPTKYLTDPSPSSSSSRSSLMRTNVSAANRACLVASSNSRGNFPLRSVRVPVLAPGQFTASSIFPITLGSYASGPDMASYAGRYGSYPADVGPRPALSGSSLSSIPGVRDTRTSNSANSSSSERALSGTVGSDAMRFSTYSSVTIRSSSCRGGGDGEARAEVALPRPPPSARRSPAAKMRRNSSSSAPGPALLGSRNCRCCCFSSFRLARFALSLNNSLPVSKAPEAKPAPVLSSASIRSPNLATDSTNSVGVNPSPPSGMNCTASMRGSLFASSSSSSATAPSTSLALPSASPAEEGSLSLRLSMMTSFGTAEFSSSELSTTLTMLTFRAVSMPPLAPAPLSRALAAATA